MEFMYPVTYLKCQTCDAKIHCDRCSKELEESLMRSWAVESVKLDLQRKLVYITGEDEDDLLDALDDLGIFTD